MNKNNIIFPLNESDKIVIALEEPLTVVHCCYQAPLIIYLGEKKYTFPSESIRHMIQCLIHLLEKALQKKLYAHESITNLGHAQNEYYQNELSVAYENKEWVGMHNLLWSGKGASAWLYNDKNGAITLEITPVYAYPINDSDDEHYIPYEQWIKNYKTYARKEIPFAVAQEWLKKAKSILHTIENTMAQEKRIYENNQGADLTDTWYEILKKEYNIIDPRGIDATKVPSEFLTDAWWKKRGL